VLLALLLPAALAARGAARLRASELALFLPALAIGALAGVVAAPLRGYELTLLASLASIGLLAIASTAACAEAAWSAAPACARRTACARLALRNLEREWPTRPTGRALLAAMVLLVPSFVFARRLEADHERWDRGERGQATVVLAGSTRMTRPSGDAVQVAAIGDLRAARSRVSPRSATVCPVAPSRAGAPASWWSHPARSPARR
jgi:hypothetical protein